MLSLMSREILYGYLPIDNECCTEKHAPIYELHATPAPPIIPCPIRRQIRFILSSVSVLLSHIIMYSSGSFRRRPNNVHWLVLVFRERARRPRASFIRSSLKSPHSRKVYYSRCRWHHNQWRSIRLWFKNIPPF